MQRRNWIILGGVLVFTGWYLFRPELLFVRTHVNESLPATMAAQPAPGASGSAVLAGSFRSHAHETKGIATLHQSPDGTRLLRLTDFVTSNGPDVRVYLVAASDAVDNETVEKAGFVELGKLKGTDGDQNYDVPADLDLSRYRAVTIWCKRFSVNFGTAPLTPPAGAGIQVGSINPVKATRFTIEVENISKGEALKLSTGASAPFVSAPVLWAIHTGNANLIFSGGKPDAGQGLEALAETGNPSALVKSLTGAGGIVAVGAAARPVGATTEGPITPGQSYNFEVVAEPGQALSVAWMFGQSNDLFYSNDRPIALFDPSGRPTSGEMTTRLSLWDAGTEVNEEPGLGPNQGPRQAKPDAGATEHKAIAHVQDQFTYPATGDVLRIAITPAGAAVSSK